MAVRRAGPPPWMPRAGMKHRRAALRRAGAGLPAEPVHPLHRYAAQPATEPEQDYHEPQHHADEQPADPSRYDDALYGQLESGAQEYARDPAFPDDPYAYQSGYDEEPEPKKRSSGLMTVIAVLALAVVGTGAAFAYRTYVGTPRSGEPPIIKADNSPTKVVPAPGDAAASKTPDRMLPGDGGEKLVSREETPVDVNSKSGPRVVFPPLNQNGSPPPVASVSPAAPPPATAANGTLPNNEPRKIKTLAVKGDAAENGGAPAGVAAAKPAARTPAPAAVAPSPRNPSSANASANDRCRCRPRARRPVPEPAPTRVAATNPAQTAPASGGAYLVQVSSQKNEADAHASYRALQSKFPTVLGSPASSSPRRSAPSPGPARCWSARARCRDWPPRYGAAVLRPDPRRLPAAPDRQGVRSHGPAIRLSTVIGPVVAGLLMKADLLGSGWRALFLINLPVGVFALAAAAGCSRGRAVATRARGSTASAPHCWRPRASCWSSRSSTAARRAGRPGCSRCWPPRCRCSPPSSLHQRARLRAGRAPLVEVSVLRKRSYVSGIVFTLVFFGSIVGFSLTTGLFLQIGLGFGPMHAALYLAAMAVGAFFGAGVGAWAATAVGRPILHVGLTIMAVGSAVLYVSLRVGRRRASGCGTWLPGCSSSASGWG